MGSISNNVPPDDWIFEVLDKNYLEVRKDSLSMSGTFNNIMESQDYQGIRNIQPAFNGMSAFDGIFNSLTSSSDWYLSIVRGFRSDIRLTGTKSTFLYTLQDVRGFESSILDTSVIDSTDETIDSFLRGFYNTLRMEDKTITVDSGHSDFKNIALENRVICQNNSLTEGVSYGTAAIENIGTKNYIYSTGDSNNLSVSSYGEVIEVFNGETEGYQEAIGIHIKNVQGYGQVYSIYDESEASWSLASDSQAIIFGSDQDFSISNNGIEGAIIHNQSDDLKILNTGRPIKLDCSALILENSGNILTGGDIAAGGKITGASLESNYIYSNDLIDSDISYINYAYIRESIESKELIITHQDEVYSTVTVFDYNFSNGSSDWVSDDWVWNGQQPPDSGVFNISGSDDPLIQNDLDISVGKSYRVRIRIANESSIACFSVKLGNVEKDLCAINGWLTGVFGPLSSTSGTLFGESYSSGIAISDYNGSSEQILEVYVEEIKNSKNFSIRCKSYATFIKNLINDMRIENTDGDIIFNASGNEIKVNSDIVLQNSSSEDICAISQYEDTDIFGLRLTERGNPSNNNTFDILNYTSSDLWEVSTNSLKITTDSIGFFGSDPIIQQDNSDLDAGTHTSGSSGVVYEDSTFNGYSVGQIVDALQKYGLLA